MTNQYQNTPFPDHNIDPSKKDGAWLLKGAKAAWGDCSGMNMFWHARETYQVLRDYSYGRQSFERYKPALNVDKAADASPLNVMWAVRPVVSKYMDIIISIMMNKQRKAIATPIDALAKDKADEYFAEARAKIMMRDALMQVNPELAQSPYLMPAPGEPENMEELEMQMSFGFKFNLAMEAEMGIKLVQYQNNLPICREQVCKDIVQLGVGGYKDWIDENGKPRFRDCDPAKVIMSWCKRSDFSDKIYVGEIIEPTIAEISQYFTDEQLEIIKSNAVNQLSTSDEHAYSKSTEKLKVCVLDLEILTWNDDVYSRMMDNNGNVQYKERKYENIVNKERVKELSNIYDVKTRSYLPKYFAKKHQCWYKIKWVIGTDLYYDDGKVQNQKRPKNNLEISESSYHFKAVNFNQMTAQGITERLRPIIDEYQLTIYKIQDFKNKWLPYIMEIDFDALESVALGAGGAVWTPEKILELVYQHRALVVRKKDISGINPNYKAMEIHSTGMAAELGPLMTDLARLLQEMNDVTGLNPITDGTGAGERKGKMVAQLEYQATNNALERLMFADKVLFESLSKGCIRRLIQAVKMGKVEGVATALGNGTVKFIQVSPDVALHEYGIEIADVPTDEEVSDIITQMGISQQKDLFRPQDIFMIKSMDNLKQMQQMIAYLYEKRVKEQHAKEMEKINATVQGQQQSAVIAEQAKQQTLQLEYQLKTQSGLILLDKEKELLLLKLQSAENIAADNNQTKVITNKDTADAKVISTAVQADGKIEDTHVAGEKAKEKQEIANQKPVAKSKS